MSAHTETTDELCDVLQRNGFVRCDIAACNCGSWHARYGYRQRLEEVTELIADAGHPLTNENGHLVKLALSELIAERGSLRAVNAELLSALESLIEAADSMSGTYGRLFGKTPEDDDTFIHEQWAEGFLLERSDEARAAIARATAQAGRALLENRS